jgi:hypothetical protein
MDRAVASLGSKIDGGRLDPMVVKILGYLQTKMYKEILKGFDNGVAKLSPRTKIKVREVEWHRRRMLVSRIFKPATFSFPFEKLTTSKIIDNGIEMESAEGCANYGLALDLLTSFVNHSCAPNCDFFFEDGAIRVRATNSIDVNEELTIKYCQSQCYVARQEYLKMAKGINCKCK